MLRLLLLLRPLVLLLLLLWILQMVGSAAEHKVSLITGLPQVLQLAACQYCYCGFCTRQ